MLKKTLARPEIRKVIHSKLDNTIKYVYRSQGQIIEFSYIDKKDSKDIICASTQTSCRLGCKFCFLSDYDLAVRNLSPEEIVGPISEIVDGLPSRNDVLLISFMGCGEPLLNLDNVIESAKQIIERYSGIYKVVRFAVATLIPHPKLMEKFIRLVHEEKVPMKLHLSLHSPDDERRKVIMPSAYPVRESISFVEEFMRKTGGSSEVHYALMDGVNDRDEDLGALISLLEGRNIPVKFLIYNKKPSVDFTPSKRVKTFRTYLEHFDIKTEFYVPPGGDIGSSCGQFLMEDYARYNAKKKRSVKNKKAK